MPLSSLQRRWLVRAACFALFAGLAFGVGRQLPRPAAPSAPPPAMLDPADFGRVITEWELDTFLPYPRFRERRLPEDDEEGRWPLAPPEGPYGLAIEDPGTLGGLRARDPRGELRLLRRETGETIWSRTLAEVEAIRWSGDGRGLLAAGALADAPELPGHRRGYLHFTCWREGAAPRAFALPADIYYFDRLAWSPDQRRVLLLTAPTFGAAEMVHLDLWLLDPAKEEPRRLPTRGMGVASAEWLSPTRIRYVYVRAAPPAEARSWEEHSATAELTVP